MSSELPVLFHDRDVIVVNKPAGWLVHRTKLSDGGEFALQAVRDQIGASVYPVHRLDRPTSGALVFALSPSCARALGAEFEARRVGKTYLAVVRGIPREKLIRVNHPLREELDKIADKGARRDKAAQEAVTDVELVADAELPFRVDRYPTSRYALVRAKPLTGRKHQIRRHLRHLGHPIVGDVTHGVGKHNRFFAAHFGARRLLLACTEIRFRHPASGETTTVRAPLAPEFARLLHRLGWGDHVEG